MFTFSPINSRNLEKVIQCLKSCTSWSLDSIPTKLFKNVYHCFINDTVNVINSSLQTGIFPASLNCAVISPLLRKDNLDPSAFNNYRAIFNLPFLSKILEKVVYKQLHKYLSIHNVHTIHTSGVSLKQLS